MSNKIRAKVVFNLDQCNKFVSVIQVLMAVDKRVGGQKALKQSKVKDKPTSKGLRLANKAGLSYLLGRKTITQEQS